MIREEAPQRSTEQRFRAVEKALQRVQELGADVAMDDDLRGREVARIAYSARRVLVNLEEKVMIESENNG